MRMALVVMIIQGRRAMTVVYYVLDGDDLLISTMAARAKALAVQRNPKVSLCILDEQWPLTYGVAGFAASFALGGLTSLRRLLFSY
jgi:hypothetical protein